MLCEWFRVDRRSGLHLADHLRTDPEPFDGSLLDIDIGLECAVLSGLSPAQAAGARLEM